MQFAIPSPPLPKREFVDRLIGFYKAQPTPELSPIWNSEMNYYWMPLKRAFETNNVNQIYNMLGGAFDFKLSSGLDDIGPIYPRKMDWFKNWWSNQLIALAKMVGVCPVVHSGQQVECRYDYEAIVKECEQTIEIHLNHNGGGLRFGMEIAGRFIPTKLLNAAAIAWVVKHLPIKVDKTLEIGAGTGLNAEVLPKPFHTIDLPLIATLQAFLLETSQGNGFVSFHGEPDRKACIHGIRRPDQTFPLILNQNSMPEMTLSQVLSYIDYIESHLCHGGCFVSINHESPRDGQVRVRTQMKNRAAFKLLQRSVWWMEPNYVLEIWQKG